MRWSCEEVAGALLVRVVGERRRGDVGQVIGSLVLMGVIHFFFSGMWLRVVAVALGGSYAVFRVCRIQFGVTELRVDADAVTLSQELFGLRRSARFPRADVEKLGYLPETRNEDAALAMMIRTLVWPKRLAYGMGAEDADRLLMAVAASDSWIAPKILRVGTPLF